MITSSKWNKRSDVDRVVSRREKQYWGIFGSWLLVRGFGRGAICYGDKQIQKKDLLAEENRSGKNQSGATPAELRSGVLH